MASKRHQDWLVKQLEDMCINIFAHAACDYEVTLSGNGINPCEASGVAWAVLDILHGNGRKWDDAHSKEINRKAAELRKEYGDE